ncbi:MAG: 23S rRNA (adenine(2503)-C(2))-methyltransferase RlmN [Polyangiaceae bacterium]
MVASAPPALLPSAFGLLPEDLAALGTPNDPEFLFGVLQRATRWPGGNAAGVLGKEGRAFVDANLDVRLPDIVASSPSEDGSTKVTLKLSDGALVEAVHMPRDVKNPRVTICISSQVGCAMGCTFCHTATMGLVRNLSAAEMVGEVLAVTRALGPVDPKRVTLVFMGMGEPLHNVDQVLRAIAVLSDERGLGIALTRITVSTAGLVPGIEALAASKWKPQLAVSINATTDARREPIMPIAKKWSLADLRAAMEAFPLRSHEKITVAYVLLQGENDTEADAQRLADLAKGFRHVVNVIPYNTFETSPFGETSDEALDRFTDWLRVRGVFTTVRRTRGREVGGACGQLATETRRAKRLPVIGSAAASAPTTPAPRTTTGRTA